MIEIINKLEIGDSINVTTTRSDLNSFFEETEKTFKSVKVTEGIYTITRVDPKVELDINEYLEKLTHFNIVEVPYEESIVRSAVNRYNVAKNGYIRSTKSKSKMYIKKDLRDAKKIDSEKVWGELKLFFKEYGV